MATPTPPQFGKAMLKHFAFGDGWRNLNHGSFGTFPTAVRDAQRSFQDMAEATPDKFNRFDQVKYLNAARAELAALVNCRVSDLVMVPNATTGINTVIRNIVFNPGDTIIYTSTTYGACKKIVLATVEFTHANSHSIHLACPMSDDAIVSLFHETVAALRNEGKNPRVAIVDTINSLPGLRMPYERLIAACKDLGILSVVDGAHGVGQLKLDLTALDPDFLVSNCHKWLYTPRGCALMYVPERNQAMIRTTFPTSHYYVPVKTAGAETQVMNPLAPLSGDDTPFTKLFEFVGTLDHSQELSVPAALKFRREVCGGEEQIMKYNSELVKAGAALVARALGTDILDNEEGTLTKDCAMVNVRLPLIAPAPYGPAKSGSAQVNETGVGHPVELDQRGPQGLIQFMERLIIDEFNAYIVFVFYEGSWWTRLSGQIYLDMEDFEFAAEVLLKVCKRVAAAEHLKKKQ